MVMSATACRLPPATARQLAELQTEVIAKRFDLDHMLGVVAALRLSVRAG
jgi:hypothetical protein